MKDVGLRIRIQRELREKFIAACREQDKSAAQVIREFMRGYVETAASSSSAQPPSIPAEGGPSRA
ncbi:MAG: hypothetical protein EOQ92_28770 [Mesorhizobium sp.]|nr:MAG: hypothetical protein EOQ92_28770 [Mesorhizobium sp.]